MLSDQATLCGQSSASWAALVVDLSLVVQRQLVSAAAVSGRSDQLC